MQRLQWIQLGGHCDGEKDVLKVAIKEAQEESGIKEIMPISRNIFDIHVHQVPKYKNEFPHIHYDIRFLLKTNGNDNFKINRESKELKWFGKDKSKLPTQKKSIMRMFDKWIGFILFSK
ncbi:MAG: NUDIX domain-containing protein [Bacteroidetes bacterium]|nr:NUDIX domain-containing protein [Bacteroidota bacterium]